MSLRRKYLEILSGMVPVGAAGISLVLGAAAPAVAAPEPLSAEPLAANQAPVSERLAAIREAVSAVAAPAANAADDGPQLAWWGNWHGGGAWRNGGGGGWRNGGGGWRSFRLEEPALTTSTRTGQPSPGQVQLVMAGSSSPCSRV
ncbi:MAG: GrrA/OscA1 family cyclophane-containing rSAM-modified RiPP [Stellaceae bacterium]